MAGTGGSWKVAYADFATAMMALFLVLWIVGQDQQVKEAIAEHFRDPSQEGPGAGSAAFPFDGGNSFAGMDAGSGADASQTDPTRGRSGRRRLVIERKQGPVCRGVVVPFTEDAATLDAAGRLELDALLPAILGKPHRVEIRGHSSGRRSEEPGYADPWELCYARCLATMKYLVERGIDPRRVRLSQGGEFEPRTRQRGSSAQAQNSRVEVTVLTEWVDGFGEIRNEQGEPLERPDFRLPTGPPESVESPHPE